MYHGLHVDAIVLTTACRVALYYLRMEVSLTHGALHDNLRGGGIRTMVEPFRMLMERWIGNVLYSTYIKKLLYTKVVR